MMFSASCQIDDEDGLDSGPSWILLRASQHSTQCQPIDGQRLGDSVVHLGPKSCAQLRQADKFKLEHADVPIQKFFFPANCRILFTWGAHMIPEGTGFRLIGTNHKHKCESTTNATTTTSKTTTFTATLTPSLMFLKRVFIWKSAHVSMAWIDSEPLGSNNIATVMGSVWLYGLEEFSGSNHAWQVHNKEEWADLQSKYLAPWPTELKDANCACILIQAKDSRGKVCSSDYTTAANSYMLEESDSPRYFVVEKDDDQELAESRNDQKVPIANTAKTTDNKSPSIVIVDSQSHTQTCTNVWLYSKPPQCLDELNNMCSNLAFHPSGNASIQFCESDSGLTATVKLDPQVNMGESGDTVYQLEFIGRYWDLVLPIIESSSTAHTAANFDGNTTTTVASTATMTSSGPEQSEDEMAWFDYSQWKPNCTTCNRSAVVYCLQCGVYFCNQVCAAANHPVNHRLEISQKHAFITLPENAIRNRSKSVSKYPLALSPQPQGRKNLYQAEDAGNSVRLSSPSFTSPLQNFCFSKFSLTLCPGASSVCYPVRDDQLVQVLNMELQDKMKSAVGPQWRQYFRYSFSINEDKRLCLKSNSSPHWYRDLKNCIKCHMVNCCTASDPPNSMRLQFDGNHCLSAGNRVWLVSFSPGSKQVASFSRFCVLVLAVSGPGQLITTCNGALLADWNERTSMTSSSSTASTTSTMTTAMLTPPPLSFLVVSPPQDFVHMDSNDIAVSERLGLRSHSTKYFTTKKGLNGNNKNNHNIDRMNYIHTVGPVFREPSKYLFVYHPLDSENETPKRTVWATIVIDYRSNQIKIIQSPNQTQLSATHRKKLKSLLCSNNEQLLNSKNNNSLRLTLVDENGCIFDSQGFDLSVLIGLCN